MTFEELVKDIKYIKGKGDFDTVVSGLQYDSRKDCQNKVFFCLKGELTDGHKYIKNASNKGAAGFVIEDWQNISGNKPVIQVEDGRAAMSKCASNYYQNPSKDMNLTGITGTNGKTTVSYLLNQIYRQKGIKSGLIGTVKCLSGGKQIPIDRTTPESVDLQKILNQMGCEGIKDCVMEVSSHSVSMKRVADIDFKQMVFTNLSQDHLDFHGDMQTYFDVKKQLFDKKGQVDVINSDDKYGKYLLNLSNDSVSYGIDSAADITAKNIYISNKGISFNMSTPEGVIKINSSLGGLFNVYNCLAAAGAALNSDFSLPQIKRGIESLGSVPGRIQFVQRKPFNVIVDYAHTPDGLENLLKSVKDFTKGKLITVFGCGGDRDKGKRPMMGHFAVTLSDFSIVTSDNPRSEDPGEIISQITQGLDNEAYWIEEDRKKAIKKAIELVKESDSVVIAGKGHETHQEINGKKHPFNDVEVVKKYL